MSKHTRKRQMTKVIRGRQTRKGRVQRGVFALPCRSGFEEVSSLPLAYSKEEGQVFSVLQ